MHALAILEKPPPHPTPSEILPADCADFQRLASKASHLFPGLTITRGELEVAASLLRGESLCIIGPQATTAELGVLLACKTESEKGSNAVTLVIDNSEESIRYKVLSAAAAGIAAEHLALRGSSIARQVAASRVREGRTTLVYSSAELLSRSGCGELLAGVSLTRLVITGIEKASHASSTRNPFYATLPQLREKFGAPPISLFGGMMPDDVSDEVLNAFGLRNVTKQSIDVAQLLENIEFLSFPTTDAKFAGLVGILAGRGAHRVEIHVPTDSDCVEIESVLKKAGTPVVRYTRADKRSDSVQRNLEAGTVVVTSRRVHERPFDVESEICVFYGAPDSPEHLFDSLGQSQLRGTGRRIVLSTPYDCMRLRSMVVGNSPRPESVVAVVEELKSQDSRPTTRRAIIERCATKSGLPEKKYEIALRYLTRLGMVGVEQGDILRPIPSVVTSVAGTSEVQQLLEQGVRVVKRAATTMVALLQSSPSESRSIAERYFKSSRNESERNFTEFIPVDKVLLDALVQNLARRVLLMDTFEQKRRSTLAITPIKRLSSQDAVAQIHDFAALGYIRILEIGGKRFVTLTKDGIKLVEDLQRGRRIEPSTSYKKLVIQGFCPSNHEVVEQMILDGIRASMGRGLLWEELPKAFLKMPFRCLGMLRPVSGALLLCNFLRLKNGERHATVAYAKQFLLHFLGDRIPQNAFGSPD